MEKLLSLIRKIDSKGYKAYKLLQGVYNFGDYILTFDHVQGDPFAAPTRISISVPMNLAGYPSELWSTGERQIAFEDYLGRAVYSAIRAIVKGQRGTGKSGEVAIEAGGQQVLIRNAIVLKKNYVEARITVGLPADGRTILGKEAEEIFFTELPAVFKKSLFYKNLSANDVKSHVDSVEDQEVLRRWLTKERLVAFIADKSILPRRSGIDDCPLDKGALPFKTPESMGYGPILPNAGKIRGMGIPEGITLIVGGGFHGKSTLLHALELGVYNHIPGDGREKVVTNSTAVKIRAEDGRAISKVNIQPFIDHLPFGKDTSRFKTENASGSTSQAANIMEALECGSTLLLIDEDTSATNFMIRDERMQSLVSHEKEPITPYLHRVRELFERHGVSSIIVMGGSGDYLDVADTTIMMDTYQPIDVTCKAKKLCTPHKKIYKNSSIPLFNKESSRKPFKRTINASKGHHNIKIDAKGLSTIFFGRHFIDLSRVEQLINIGQTRSIGWFILYYVEHFVDKTASLREGLEKVFKVAEKSGLDVFSPYKVGNLALPRIHEVAAAINRIRECKWQ